MNRVFGGSVIAAALVGSLALAGCSSGGHSEQESFAFTGDTLNVVHDNAHMSVTVSSQEDPPEGGEVAVEVTTQTLAQGPETPAWNLKGGVLNLGTPCGGAVVGYCEGSYSVTVPDGTEVFVNGQPVSVG